MHQYKFGWALLIAGISIITSLAAEDNKPATAYVTVGDIVGKIEKIDVAKGEMTLEIEQQVVDKSGTNNNNRPNMNRGRGGRGNNNQMQQMLARLRQQMQNVKTKTVEHHYDLKLTPDLKVRVMKLPEELDENGKPKKRTPEEIRKLKGNTTLPGYTASPDDLSPGQTVQLHLVRPVGAKPDTMPMVRYIYIDGEVALTPANKGEKKEAKK